MNNFPIPAPENTAFLTSEYPQYNETTEEAISHDGWSTGIPIVQFTSGTFRRT